MANESAGELARLKKQVALYEMEKRERYEPYARVLEAILKAVCELVAPCGIVQARAKTVASFAEKAVRKATKYDDPVHQLTDLCGARVIVNTSDEMHAVCALIRREFIVDEPNTGDAGTRLKIDEFGYRSFHFVVQIGQDEILGVPAEREVIGERKAEIQVRTVAQHAWAAVTHDRIFKGSFNPPARLKRLAHRSAALLEDADEALNRFEHEIQAFLGSYTAYLEPAELQREIEIARFVLSAEKTPATALRLARLLRAAGEPGAAAKMLEEYHSAPGPWRLPILVELGGALLDCQRQSGSTSERDRGRAFLEDALRIGEDAEERPRAAARSDRKLSATARAILAADAEEVHERAASYAESLRLDPDDPYVLCAQLAHNLQHTNQPAILDSAVPAIFKALDTCRTHVGLGLQIPRAWFTMGQLFILLRRDAEALDSYAKGIRFYLTGGRPDWRREDFDRQTTFLKQVAGRGPGVPHGNRWARQLLEMGYCLRQTPAEPIAEHVGGGVSFSGFLPDQPVLIVAGGSAQEVEDAMQPYRALLKAALARFNGVVVSGGTTAGIPGLVGDVAAELAHAGRKHFRLIGYRPTFASKSPHYEQVVECGQNQALGLAGPLQLWYDLLAGGVKPATVRVLGINGGPISRFEYALALALGALVGVVESSGRAADLVLRDPDWSRHPRLLPLPDDPMTAQAFTRAGVSDLPDDELERMGRIAHAVYRADTTPNYRKPNTLPWECLPEQYKASSREQAAYALEILRSTGFDVRKANGKPVPTGIPEQFIEPMAEQEHGRWNFERLTSGWRRASAKDDELKLSPYLKPWVELPDQVKEYDRRSVRAFPRILAEAGYELTPLTR